MVSLKPETKPVLDKILEKAIEEGKVAGVAFAVTSLDQELYSGVAGHKRLHGPPSEKIDEKSVFWICSMTKLVVTIALLQLVEQGKLALDAPVADIIPELSNPVVVSFTDKLLGNPVYKPAINPILIRHLLDHSSGLTYLEKKGHPDSPPLAYTKAAYKGDHSVKRFFEIIRGEYPGVPLLFEPGSAFSYGWNCEVIVFVIERLTGKSIEEYCKEFIFGPLGMKSTFYLTPAVKEDLVGLTCRKNGKLEELVDQVPIIEQDPAQLKVCLGGIGMYSTMKDYLNMLQHLLQVQSGTITQKGLLSTETVREMFRPTMPPEATKSIGLFTNWENVQFGWALCLNEDDWPGRRRKGSGFWYGWAGTYYFMDPTTGIAVVYGTQVVPTSDSEVVKLVGSNVGKLFDLVVVMLFEQLEEALYGGIVA